jgi:hypothetical protein
MSYAPGPNQRPPPGMDMNSFQGNMQQQIQVPSGTDPQTRAILMAALNPNFLRQSEEEERERERERKRRKKKKAEEPLTVESLLNIPLPSNESPQKKKEEKVETVTIEASTDNNEEVITEEMVVIESNTEEQSMSEDIELDSEGQPTKVFRFAWEDNANADNRSDVTVSSVHTSDLSSFEESGAEDLDFDEEDEGEEETAEEKTGEDERKFYVYLSTYQMIFFYLYSSDTCKR